MFTWAWVVCHASEQQGVCDWLVLVSVCTHMCVDVY